MKHTLDDFRGAKRKLQEDIDGLICKFEREYGVRVDDIKIAARNAYYNRIDGEYYNYDIEVTIK